MNKPPFCSDEVKDINKYGINIIHIIIGEMGLTNQISYVFLICYNQHTQKFCT